MSGWLSQLVTYAEEALSETKIQGNAAANHPSRCGGRPAKAQLHTKIQGNGLIRLHGQPDRKGSETHHGTKKQGKGQPASDQFAEVCRHLGLETQRQ
jgi:hypothetical protein